jgi:RHS repeat-associated protein
MAYDAEFTTVTDQAGKVRRSMMNGIGQLARVDEPDKDTGSLGSTASPVQPTSYTYDALGNLTGVVQGTQTRTFNYSSLSRLTSATNPESGTVSYTYDAGGNLKTKTDALAVTIKYEYDALSRNKTVDYSNTTINPDIERYYDNPASGAYGRGRYWKDYKGGNDSAGSEVEHRVVDAYDALGRPLTQRQKFKTGGVWSSNYTTRRTYTRSGNVDTQTLPSGRTVNHAYDAAGRLKKFTGNLGDGTIRTYATGVNPANGLEEGIQYDVVGRLTQERFGTQKPLYHKQQFNVRGQLSDIRLGLGYDASSMERGAVTINYGKTTNNGNVVFQQNWIPTDESATAWDIRQTNYSYDNLNRVTGMQEYYGAPGMVAQQVYTYDRWGNRQIDAAVTSDTLNEKQFKIDTAKNHVGVPAGQSGVMQYDAAGNLERDTYTEPFTGRDRRAYDAEGRMTETYSTANALLDRYTYDAEGRRVRRQTPTEQVWQVYGIDGELLAEYAAGAAPTYPQKEYGYRNGELLITAEGSASALPTGPTNLEAAPTNTAGTPQVTLSWGKVEGASTYRIERSALKGSPFVQAGTSTTTTFLDSGVSSQHAYLYRVCAANSAGTSCTSQYGNEALGTAYLFADDPIITLADNPTGAPLTPIKAQHVTQLREAVNSVRALAGLSAAEWAESVGSGVWVKAAHVQELRDRLREALLALSLPLPTYTDQTLSVGVNATWIQRAHFAQLRLSATRGSGAAPSGGAGGGANIQWLVSDHLGTPRIIADLSGDLDKIKRHDYLPFGEEVSAEVGGRTTGQGYISNNVRQHFIGKERDSETELDYFGARYYSQKVGRFISVDPINLTHARLYDPQRINLYSYCRGNPLKYLDPDGRDLILANATAKARARANIDATLRPEERQNIRIAGDKVLLEVKNEISNPSPAYRYLTEVIQSPTINNYFAVAKGESVTLRTPVTDMATGQEVTSFSYDDLIKRNAAYIAYDDGSADIFVPVGDELTVEGMSGALIAAPESINFAHELYGHGTNRDAVAVENEIRRSLNPALPERSGGDHYDVRFQYIIGTSEQLITTTGSVDGTRVTIKPLIPLPDGRRP